MLSLPVGGKRVRPSRFVTVFGGQELFKFIPQVSSASPRCAGRDDPPDDQDGGDQQDETGVVHEGKVVGHGRGLWCGGSQCWVHGMGRIRCIWVDAVFHGWRCRSRGSSRFAAGAPSHAGYEMGSRI